MVEVLVEHDYEAKEPDELTIKKGEIIKDVKRKNGGWWEGILNEKRGMFPDNFVKIMEKDTTPVVLRNKKDVARIRKCRVVFSYNQDHEDELNLKVGEVIDIIGEEEEGWWRGLLNGKEGVFPSNFVEEIVASAPKSKQGSREDLSTISGENNDLKAPILPAKPIKQLCEVKYPYKAQNEDELSLKQGEIVTVINKDGQDPGWWKGEINGRIGVFPDNFVTLLPNNYDDKSSINKNPTESVAIKQVSVASQRKSLEIKSDKTNSSENKTPPVPGKKPIISIKKSPSSSGSGLFSEIKKKIVDVVDGATGSKNSTHKTENTSNDLTKDNNNSENVFDQVERRPLLHDVRATRAKAPGRRPPTTLFKDEDEDPVCVNGNAEYTNVELRHSEPPTAANRNSDISESDSAEVKPKLREWEKHRAPWLEEMKLNQAKRTSTSPGPEHKLKLTPTSTIEKNLDMEESSKSNKGSPVSEKEGGLMDMSKSMSALSNKLKTPPNELEKVPVIRSKPSLPPTPSRHSLPNNLPKEPVPKPVAAPKLSPVTVKPPAPKPEKITNSNPTPNASGDHQVEAPSVSYKQYSELLERLQKLEVQMEKQMESHAVAIDELNSKLQLETELRMMMQAELEKVSQCVMQV